MTKRFLFIRNTAGLVRWFVAVTVLWVPMRQKTGVVPQSGALPMKLGSLEVAQDETLKTTLVKKFPEAKLVAFLSPFDCPSCYEFVLSEFNRLSVEPHWKRKLVLLIVGRSGETASFARILRQRYTLRFPLCFLPGDNSRYPETIVHLKTPTIMLLDANLDALRTLMITPSTLLRTSSFFDSLWTDGHLIR